MSNILIFKQIQYITEENRFGFRKGYELPSNILTTASYLDTKYDINLKLLDNNITPDFSKYKIVVQWVSIADGFDSSLELFQKAKEENCINILVLFDDWEKISLNILQDFPFIDYAIRGVDREINLGNLLSYLEKKEPFPQKGIVFRENNNVIDSGTYINSTLEHLKSSDKYISQVLSEHKFSTYLLRISSGCPYPCTFCNIGLRSNRFRKIEDVLNELYTLPEGVTVQLASSDILQNTSWVEEFCNKVIDTGKKYTFETDIRIDNAKDIKLLQLMKKAGFDQLAIGIESYDTKVSKSMKKGYTYKKIQDGFERLLDVGLSPGINFMIGHYLDSEESLLKTMEEIKKLNTNVKIVGFQYLRPLPGTKIEEESIKEKVLKYPLGYKDFINIRHEPVMPTKFLSKTDLKIWMELFYSIRIDEKNNCYYFAKQLDNCGNDMELSNKVISVAPHPISLYKNNLKNLQDQGYNFITTDNFYSNNYNPKKLNILLRHDIDFRPNKIELFTDIETSLNLRSDIYVILDNDYYDIKPHISKLKKLAQDGFTLGLHTLAPGNENFKEILQNEINEFEKLFGFKPEYFTIHGKCPTPQNWNSLKQDFITYVKNNWDSLPFKGSHNIQKPYDWVEDISIDGGEYSVLRRKFLEIPKNYYYGVIGILTHPIHWSNNDVAWDIKNDNWKNILD